MKEFKWYEKKFYMTKCCGSLNWSETNKGTFCHTCNSVKPDNVTDYDEDTSIKLSMSYYDSMPKLPMSNLRF